MPLNEMQAVFAHNLEMFAELAEQLLVEDQIKAIRRIRQLRDQINAGFQAVTAQSDAVLFDFGPVASAKAEDSQRHPAMAARYPHAAAGASHCRAISRTKLRSQIYLSLIAKAGVEFEKDLAQVMRAMASEVSERPVRGCPDIRLSRRENATENPTVLSGSC